MRRKVFVVVLLSLVLTACHAPKTVVTPQGKAAYAADQVVIRVNELGKAAIVAESGGGLSHATTAIIVDFCLDADKTLAKVPEGWRKTVLEAWTAAKKRIPAADLQNPAIAALITTLEGLLAATTDHYIADGGSL